MAGRVTIICSLLAVLSLSVLGNATGPQRSEKEKVRAVTASASQSLTYQGVLKDASENPIPNAALDIIFRIYDDPDAGDILWQQGLSVKTDKGGYFNAILSDLDLPSDRQYYLSLQVEGDAEMSPRQMLRLPGVPVVAGSDPSPPVIAQTRNWDGDGEVIWPDTLWGISHAERGTGVANNELFGNNANTHINLGIGSETGTDGQHYSYSTVGGGYGNKAKKTGSTVAGGDKNEAGGSYSAVSGGASNTATGTNSFVGGGNLNYAPGKYTVVAGGLSNSAEGDYSTVSGGKDNVIWQLFPPTAATIGGGEDNEVGGHYNTISGGRQNYARYSTYSTIGGGQNNDADGDHSTIGGGKDNEAGGDYSTAGGGLNNTSSGARATIAGGYSNTASNMYSAIGGGSYNNVSGTYGTIAGGYSNIVAGSRSSIPGGYQNSASGDYSFAAGTRAKADHNGTFVWADLTGPYFTSTAVNQFLIRANGGVGIGTASPSNELSVSGDADFSGNVGIGISSPGPGAALDVRGIIHGEGMIQIFDPSDHAGSAWLKYNETTNRAELSASDLGEPRPVSIGSATFTDDKVGIGTTSPQTKLHVENGAVRSEYLDPGFRFPTYEYMRFGTDTEFWAGFMHNISDASFGNGDDFAVYTYGNRDLVLYPGTGQTHLLGGNVGVGTTSPSSKLDVAGTAEMTGFKMPTGAGEGKLLTSDASGIGTWDDPPLSSLWSSDTHGINYSTGNVGIGADSDENARLNILGDVIVDQSVPGVNRDGRLILKNSGNYTVAILGTDVDSHGHFILNDATGNPIFEVGEGLDYAEAFSTPYDDLEPGTVMIIDPENPGRLRVSGSAYDKRVAGIVAGANGLSSGVKLGSTGADGEHPVALAGRVYCKVDGKYGAIEPGDLLTTSPNPGFAMLVKDHSKAQGAILGKAMQALPAGDSGEILVLVTLQ
jgi:hypothetical protein